MRVATGDMVQIEGRKSPYFRPGNAVLLAKMLLPFTIEPCVIDYHGRLEEADARLENKHALRRLAGGDLVNRSFSGDDYRRTQSLVVIDRATHAVEATILAHTELREVIGETDAEDAVETEEFYIDFISKPELLLFRPIKKEFDTWELFAYRSIYNGRREKMLARTRGANPEQSMLNILARLGEAPSTLSVERIVPAEVELYDRAVQGAQPL